jgi:hypothetical protein
MFLTKGLSSIFVISAMICILPLSVAPGKIFAEETRKEAGVGPVPSLPPEELEKRWGIRPLSIRQTADGNMLDFRYRVMDAEKASPLFHPTIKPLIIDENTGAVMAVPTVPKVGSMRSTRKPLKDRNYFMLFANPQGHIRPQGDCGHRRLQGRASGRGVNERWGDKGIGGDEEMGR